ncbi:ribonuclease III [Engelhardtia mirabilis]|uniref:Ribonuclease 3 n=1 Tax=Engelhardtia mirabilis TaxID=2528011 RepID=A0A518BRK4_9BACT|nr:Ribonuclease 3 [Planctomycetes bacterium Pla133]QDV03933.1 Ribonuclease 3 [Planctomycetes bacterium Pla86]
MARTPYRFRDPRLLELALTHASSTGGEDNERLEFLGDAVLDLLVAEHLFQVDPRASEGELTERKAMVVSRQSLALAAKSLDLDREARVGRGLRDSTLPRSVLANLYEAILGAIYLDGGLEASREFVDESLGEALGVAARQPGGAEPKQRLQHLAQTRTGSPPTYVVVAERGQAHARAFLVAAQIDGDRFPSAWGRTRKEAERWAALEALLVLDDGSGV